MVLSQFSAGIHWHARYYLKRAADYKIREFAYKRYSRRLETNQKQLPVKSLRSMKMKSTALLTIAILLTALSELHSHPVEIRQFRAADNPIPLSRHERSANPEPQVSLGAWNRGSSVIAGPELKIGNERGSIGAIAGQRFPAQSFTPNIGLQGSYNLPHGTATATWDRVPSGPLRGSTLDLQYRHQLQSSPRGSTHLTVGGSKSTGRDWQYGIGLVRTF